MILEWDGIPIWDVTGPDLSVNKETTLQYCSTSNTIGLPMLALYTVSVTLASNVTYTMQYQSLRITELS